MRMKSGPSSIVAPSLRASMAMAAMRSVSFTRQLAMLRSVVVPSAKSAITARVMAASGMWLQSRSMALSGQLPRLMCRRLASLRMSAPMRRAASTNRMSPWMEDSPTPSMVMPAVARAGGCEGAQGNEVAGRRGVALHRDADPERRIGCRREPRNGMRLRCGRPRRICAAG